MRGGAFEMHQNKYYMAEKDPMMVMYLLQLSIIYDASKKITRYNKKTPTTAACRRQALLDGVLGCVCHDLQSAF